MKLHIIDLGKIVMMGENPVSKNTDDHPAIPIHVFLLESPVGYILFDTGCVPGCMEGQWPAHLLTNPYVPSPKGGLVEQLAGLGVKPEEIPIVVASHLHLDHAGGLHLFPNARVYVSRAELDTVYANAAAGDMGMFHLPCDYANWQRAGIRWETVSAGEQKLCDGVTILNLGPGHSYGMLGLLVELESLKALLVADAIYARVHYGPPAQLSGAVVDEKGYFDTIERIRDHVNNRGATMFFGHDMEQFQTLKKAPEGYYD